MVLTGGEKWRHGAKVNQVLLGVGDGALSRVNLSDSTLITYYESIKHSKK